MEFSCTYTYSSKLREEVAIALRAADSPDWVIFSQSLITCQGEAFAYNNLRLTDNLSARMVRPY
ncbi:hypothetical protein H6F61_12515 [Cyanobacteria bacterium FACHB-472]|nr:hypothetical protein [Cyanobacteria bacterium FACHB-472]